MMKQTAAVQEDKKIEIIMGNLLRIGVITAASFVIFGAVFYLIRNGFTAPHYGIFKGEPSELKVLPEIFKNMIAFQPRAIMQFGLILLIATPVARVIFSVIAFLYEKDLMYVIFTLIVLAVLLYSFFSTL